MPNLIETYANACGVKITKKPSLAENYFPVPERYITVHASSGMDSKNYSYYSEVFELIANDLKKNKIHIIQIGQEEDETVEYVSLQFKGMNTLRQSAYVVKNSMLHIGNDSCWMHYAGANNVPIIELFGPTLPAAHAPHFVGKHTYIESHRNGFKPSFNNEKTKTIDFIKPEIVAQSILDSLGIDKKIGMETLHIGKIYKSKILEIVPNFSFGNHFDKQFLNIRMDYHYDENFLHRALQTNNCSITTNKALSIEMLKYFEPRIKKVIYRTGPDIDMDFVNLLHSNRVPYIVSTTEKEDSLAKLKMKLFDYNSIVEEKSINIEEAKKKINENKNGEDVFSKINEETLFRSKRYLISNGALYTSLFHCSNDIKIRDFNNNILKVGEALNHETFWENLDHFHLFNIEKK